MSIESLAIALHHSKLEGTARLVLIGIANHDGDGGAWPSIATLARYAHVHPRTVQKVLPKLVAAREIRIHYNEGGTPGSAHWSRPNLYEFLLDCPPYCDRSKHHRDTRGQDTPIFVETATNPLAPFTPGGNGGTTPLATGAPAPLATGAPEPPEEPSMNLPSVLEVDARARAGQSASALKRRCEEEGHFVPPGDRYCIRCGERVADDWGDTTTSKEDDRAVAS